MKDITKIEFEKYKCFNNLVKIENIKPINIIIGKDFRFCLKTEKRGYNDTIMLILPK